MLIKESETIAELKELLKVGSKIVITTHQNPDGDALGSVLALFGFLIKMGHHVTVITPNDYPEFLQWLPGNDLVVDYSKQKSFAEYAISQAQYFFVLDFNDSRRAGDMKDVIDAALAKKIMLDHHPFPQMKADFSFSFTEASSTCEIVYEFIAAMGGLKNMDTNIAECIYTGIMTDTGCFSYNASRPDTFEIVASLLKFNIRKDEIYHRLYDNNSTQRMRLLGYCLNEKMQVLPEYHTAFISLSIEEQKNYNFNLGDSEGIVNYPLSIKGIFFSAMFIERKDKTKISFRSKGTFPVNKFSEAHFAGGGHMNAAGGESTLSLSETITKFTGLLPQYTQELKK